MAISNREPVKKSTQTRYNSANSQSKENVKSSNAHPENSSGGEKKTAAQAEQGQPSSAYSNRSNGSNNMRHSGIGRECPEDDF
jgi:hypothetical protein